MPREAKAISTAAAKKLPVGAHALGGAPGLMLRVRASGLRTIVLDYRNGRGQKRRYNLGKFPTLSLADARKRARKLLTEIGEGADPVAERRAARVVPLALAEAVEGWMADAAGRLRPGTRRTYSCAVGRFLRWADGKVVACADLERAHLAAFRAHLVKLPKHAGKRGGPRGAKRATAQRRSASAVNYELRTIKTILNALRRAGQLPGLDRDAIRDNLAALPVDREQPKFLSPAKIVKLLDACRQHDAETFELTRQGETDASRYRPIYPFALFLLLTGCRRGEALRLRWRDVDLAALNNDGKAAGEIRILASESKTHRGRTVYLDAAPSLRELLGAMDQTTERVFEGYTADSVSAARARLLETYGAPTFDWQMLRSTCATYLTNAPGIFGAASVFLSARQLGHSVAVAERHYLGVVRGIPRDARTLEAAMRIA